MRDILIIMTGGTIDAEAYPDPVRPPRYAIPLKDSIVPHVVEELGYEADCRFFQWMMKDSKDFSEMEIYALSVFIEQRRAQHIIVTHGTDRMPENARQLKTLLKGSGKTTVITGAMVPLANGKNSDGYDNLRYAIEHIESWPPGVHVVMHGQRFDPVRLKKNFSTRRMEEES
jgi:L-asparaginase